MQVHLEEETDTVRMNLHQEEGVIPHRGEIEISVRQEEIKDLHPQRKLLMEKKLASFLLLR